MVRFLTDDPRLERYVSRHVRPGGHGGGTECILRATVSMVVARGAASVDGPVTVRWSRVARRLAAWRGVPTVLCVQLNEWTRENDKHTWLLCSRLTCGPRTTRHVEELLEK